MDRLNTHRHSSWQAEESSETSLPELQTHGAPQRAASSRIQQLEAELWVERFCNQLSDHLANQLLNHKHQPELATALQPEAEIFQIIVNELRSTLGSGIVAIALPYQTPNPPLATTPATSEAILAFRIGHVAPQQLQRSSNSVPPIAIATSKPFKFSLGELLPLTDLQTLHDQSDPIAWPILNLDGKALGWLIASDVVCDAVGETKLSTLQAWQGPLRTHLIERLIHQCAIAVQQARQLNATCPQCQNLEARNRELERSNQLKSEFLANTSHEIRTPLSSILGFTHLLREQGFNPSSLRHREYLNIILTSGQHLLALINDILDLSKIEANQLDLQCETTKVEEICRSVLKLVKEKASDKGLELRLDLDPNVTTFVSDPLRLKQMLFNLLSNALKFTTKGTVGLQVRLAGIFLDFTVWDTGTGISYEQQQQLFRPYSQIANAVVSRDEGTGLGLALTQKLAELHGGWVEVESELNRGSRFTVKLPLTPQLNTQPIRECTEALPAISTAASPAVSSTSAVAESAAKYQVETEITVPHSSPRSNPRSNQSSAKPRTTPDISSPTSSATPTAQRSRLKRTAMQAASPSAQAALRHSTESVIAATPEETATGMRVSSRPRALSTHTRPYHILLIEDHVPNAKLLIAYLSKLGYEVTWVKNATEMWQALAISLPALMLMDIHLPEIDGLCLTRELRSYQAYQQLPIIAQTAMAMTGDREVCLEAGFTDYLTKPIDLSALAQMVAKYSGGVEPHHRLPQQA
ncbi:ATP-binding protein [Trichocoleus sp. FACHB-262]|uniref:ATP-binding protein n=1 Tax=Trichocoleus sp. FACHB-262 TaxID=2692869 RepID=UPI0019C5715B|nr:ATP-binding protein [Trichocoleus sp. FACHB-262]MBD2124517.1 response regulator [Trichocoleus sp. FACHB-262]